MLRSKIIFTKTKNKTADTAWYVMSFPWSTLSSSDRSSRDQSECEESLSYCKKSIGTCQEKMGFSGMRGGMNMCRTVYLKMRITRCCGILIYEQTMKLRLGDWIYWPLTEKRNNCNIIDEAIMDNGRLKGASKRISLMGTSTTDPKYRSLSLTQNTGHHAYERTLIY